MDVRWGSDHPGRGGIVRRVPRLPAPFCVLVGLAAFMLMLPDEVRLSAQHQAGFVLGQVVDAGSGRPIPAAEVRLEASLGARSRSVEERDSLRVLTNSSGQFLFRDLERRVYTFRATAAGYLPGGYGQRVPGGAVQPFELGAGERVGDLVIRLWRAASISGAVRDDRGEPIADISVTLARREGAGTGVRFTNDRSGANQATETDDRGAYAFSGLSPGEYVVSVPMRATLLSVALLGADRETQQALGDSGSSALASAAAGGGAAVRLGDALLQLSGQGHWAGSNPLGSVLPTALLPDGGLVGYPTTFHPDALAAPESIPIVLAAGDHASGIDVVMRPRRLGRVTGHVTSPAGSAANLAVHLIPAYAADEWLERTHETAVAATDRNGRFEFLAVPPGRYVIRSWRRQQGLAVGRDPRHDEPTLWGEATVSVGDAGTQAVDVLLQPGVVVSGRVEFGGGGTIPRPQRLQPGLSVAFEPAWRLALGTRMAVRVAASGEFVTLGLPPGRYVANLPNQFTSFPGWHFESATRAGQDLTMVRLTIGMGPGAVDDVVIRFSDRVTSLGGVVRDARGEPDARAAVVVFPADYETWIEHGMSAASSWEQLVSQRGTYSMTLRPGRYLVAAIDGDLLAGWRRPQTIRNVAASATPVTLASGDARQQDLRTGGGQ